MSKNTPHVYCCKDGGLGGFSGKESGANSKEEDPQARLLHTLHVGISITPHRCFQEAERHGNQARRSDGVCAAVVPVVACCEPSGADPPCKES